MIVSMISEMSCPSLSPVFFPASKITLPSCVSSDGRLSPSGRFCNSPYSNNIKMYKYYLLAQ